MRARTRDRGGAPGGAPGRGGVSLLRVAFLSLASISLSFLCAAPPSHLVAAARPPEIVVDAAAPPGTVHRHVFTEGDAPVALTGASLDAGVAGGAPLVRAVVVITNPLDAPLERLGFTATYAAWHALYGAWAEEEKAEDDDAKDAAASLTNLADVKALTNTAGGTGPGVNLADVRATAMDEIARRDRIAARLDLANGLLVLDAALRRGEELLDAMDAPTTHALRDALRNVTYAHAGKRPDDTTRGISLTVYDASGKASAPASFLVDIVPVNNPAILDLNGAHRPGVDYAAVMGENERFLGVALADADAHVEDDDGRFIRGGRVYYDPDVPGAAFPDGAGERVTLTLEGSSVTGAWDASSNSFTLEGADTLEAYRGIFASARYVNEGRVNVITNQSPQTRELLFTGGVRRFVFEITDDAGAVSTAIATVNVSEVTRVGDPARDENQRTPAECSGNGARDVNDILGTGDPEACVCDLGFEGDDCELHPCNDHGYLTFYVASTGHKECECDLEFSGPTCNVACNGRGVYDSSTHACECDKGVAGRLCDVVCDTCDASARGECVLTDASEASWNDATFSYDVVETQCLCEDFWMGDGCLIPCPCARGGFARGTCAVDANLLAAGLTADEFLGVCLCEPGWVGEDCTIACPACDAGNGDCVPPSGAEVGHGAAFNAIANDPQLSPAQREARIAAANVSGVCACRMSQSNVLGGLGFNGDDCSVACAPCDYGTCQADGSCLCFPGFVGATCDVECSGNGVLVYPSFNATYTAADFDALPGVPGNDNYLNSGLLDVLELYGMSERFEGDNETSTRAYCACGYTRDVNTGEPVPRDSVFARVANELDGFGYAGVFCEIPCAPCDETNGQCTFDGVNAVCRCRADVANDATSASAVFHQRFGEDTTGFGFAGPSCETPCKPCLNGTCSNVEGSYGECVCDHGFADDACAIECGSPAFKYTSQYEGDGAKDRYVGRRGNFSLTRFDANIGFGGTTAGCHCDYMWTGPMCDHPCPFPYNTSNGICVVKDESDEDYGAPWTAEIVCEDGFTGLPDFNYRLTPDQLSRGRHCEMTCQDCVHGTCQDDGTCLCDYGYIWQGPLEAESDVGFREAVLPYPWTAEYLGENAYVPRFHTCAAKHPCNQNGELVNATCGSLGQGFVDDIQPWTVVDERTGGGFGCPGNLVDGVNGTRLCLSLVNGVETHVTPLFAMGYFIWSAGAEEYVRNEFVKRTFSKHGQIQGGYCESDDDLNEGQPLHGGYCVCDGIRNERFQHPSAKSQEGEGYDYFFQGWAGPACEIPCEPCSENGVCDATTGRCSCFEGWNGYRCMTPCEPCEHGTCQYDGTCLCDGSRRLRESTYALRLTRDPFYLEKGEHVYEVHGGRRSRYVHPVYMNTYDLEDYIWELEYECPNREECNTRTMDTHLPTRPNETYFRYTTPNVLEVIKVNDEMDRMQAYRDSLVTDVENVPDSMTEDEVCDFTDATNVVTTGACIEKMKAKLFGRTTQGCGAEWDSVRPWDCDDVVKSHFIRERNLELGSVEVQRMRMLQSTEAENVWFANNVNERQRLINTMSRGRFDRDAGAFQHIRDPDYYMIWIVHQLIHGVTSGDGYAGWSCDVKCEACDATHGTCQYDGTCECVEGWYGAACDKMCDCFRHVAVKNALELQNQIEDVLLESVDSQSGIPIQPHGTCQRDGSCACYPDPDGTRWTGVDCFTKCKPCNQGTCQFNGDCECDPGWTGEDCSVPRFVQCLPCNFDHGTCLADGTCKCDVMWTGFDCSVRCSPCVHGDCRMDGSCHCRPGWTLPDCSKKMWDGGEIRSDFSLSSEGWRVHNNSCPGLLDAVVGGAADAGAIAAAVIRGRCDGDADGGGDGGLEWDGASGYLYLTDRLPNDRPGEVAYFRAPGKFLGDKLAVAYNATIAYELYLAGGADPFSMSNAAHAKPAFPHPVGSDAERAPDVVLIGGRPRYRLDPPPWDVWDKHAAFEWSRENFPELALNLRWSKSRIVDTVEAYLDTPQVVLGIRAPRVKHYPPESCYAEHCSINFNFDLHENAGWFNMPFVPAGLGWSTDIDAVNGDGVNPYVYTVEGTKYVGKREGSAEGYNPFDGLGLGPEDVKTEAMDAWRANPKDSRAFRADAGETSFVFESGDGAGVAPFPKSPYMSRIYAQIPPGTEPSMRVVLDIIARETANGNPPPKGSAGAYAPGTFPGGGGLAGTSTAGSTRPNANDGYARSVDALRRRWDVLPEVYAAINANRADRVGTNATFTEIAWVLASLTEILIKADYYGAADPARYTDGELDPWIGDPMGPGETVRLDHVIISKRDPEMTADRWNNEEFKAFMKYVDQYATTYYVKFLADYYAAYAEEVRLSICSGNGVYASGSQEDPSLGCDCDDGWRGDDCELLCPACANGACVVVNVTTTTTTDDAAGSTAIETTTLATTCDCELGWAGTLCDVQCPPCEYEHSACVTDAAGNPACACDAGRGGAYCQHECPPCDYGTFYVALDPVRPRSRDFSTCDSTTYFGDFPGDAAKCACDDARVRAGVLCELPCPPAPNYCGAGRCSHVLDGRRFDDTTALERSNDFPFCACDVGWVGAVCELPCPGTADHPVSPGPYACLGRGTCSQGAVGARCQCVSGYMGDRCQTLIGVCGDGVLNDGEECDDGNGNPDDGCDNACRIGQNYVCALALREDILAIDGVDPTYYSVCTCPGVFSNILGCLMA